LKFTTDLVLDTMAHWVFAIHCTHVARKLSHVGWTEFRASFLYILYLIIW